jgi:outer membrane lipoprotein carrier protein
MAIAAPTLQERLDTFQTLSAEFTQTTLSDGAKETLKGIMKIKRPNRFYWKIEQPYPQEIVSNGQTLWQYEPDLDQVIVRKVDAELQGVPLLLLSGKTSELETLFTVKAESDSRFTLTPKSEDQVVKKVVIAFSQDRLKSLTIENTLGQDIQIVFSKVEQNTPLEDQAFEFKIPKGVEVLEQ